VAHRLPKLVCQRLSHCHGLGITAFDTGTLQGEAEIRIGGFVCLAMADKKHSKPPRECRDPLQHPFVSPAIVPLSVGQSNPAKSRQHARMLAMTIASAWQPS